MVFSLKLVGQTMVNPEPSQLTKYYQMRMWKQLLLFSNSLLMKTLFVRRWRLSSIIVIHWSMMKKKQQMSFQSFHGFWTHQDWKDIFIHWITEISHAVSLTVHYIAYFALQTEQDFEPLFGEVIATNSWKCGPPISKQNLSRKAMDWCPPQNSWN